MYCVFCKTDTIFSNFGSPVRKNVLCTQCNSLERHRLIWTWLERFEIDLLQKARLLHIAAEPCLSRVLRPIVREYLAPTWDLRKTPATDNYFDIIFHNHVMEHIFEDITAFCEQLRILRPGGVLLFTVPLRGDHNVESVDAQEDEETRKVKFGQSDHWRWYGVVDIVERITNCGFKDVRVIDVNSGKEFLIRSVAPE